MAYCYELNLSASFSRHISFKIMKLLKAGFVFSALVLFTFSIVAQVSEDSLILARINKAANTNSSIAETINQLADIHGPRLLGTENYYRSAQWIKQKLMAEGMDTVWFQAFDKQYRG